MRAIRIGLLIANGVWLPLYVVGGAERVYYFATYPTTHDQTFAAVLLAVAIPAVVGSFILAGNIAYIWRLRPRAIRIVLLIGNGVMLFAQVTAGPMHVFLLAKDVEWPFDATAWADLLPEAISIVVRIIILAGNIAYIWRLRPHAHNEKGASASHAPAPHG